MSPGFRVVLDIFSGRPNPDWLLSAPEMETLVDKLRQLSHETGPAGMPRLGYRGFEVYRTDSPRSGPWLRIAGERVTVLDDRGSRTYRDSEGIEAWLQGLARNRGMDPLIQSGRASRRPRE